MDAIIPYERMQAPRVRNGGDQKQREPSHGDKESNAPTEIPLTRTDEAESPLNSVERTAANKRNILWRGVVGELVRLSAIWYVL